MLFNHIHFFALELRMGNSKRVIRTSRDFSKVAVASVALNLVKNHIRTKQGC
jgi:hypothetical protein